MRKEASKYGYVYDSKPPYELIHSNYLTKNDKMCIRDRVYTVTQNLINKPTKVEISKQDITTNKELPGAHLRLEDITTGNTILIEEWVSDLKPHIIKGLIVGHIYRLTETMAPAGYKICLLYTSRCV